LLAALVPAAVVVELPLPPPLQAAMAKPTPVSTDNNIKILAFMAFSFLHKLFQFQIKAPS
jgi:hypothetical protein